MHVYVYVLAIPRVGVKDVLLLSVAGAKHHDQGNLEAKVFNWIYGFRGPVPWWQSESMAAGTAESSHFICKRRQREGRWEGSSASAGSALSSS